MRAEISIASERRGGGAAGSSGRTTQAAARNATTVTIPRIPTPARRQDRRWVGGGGQARGSLLEGERYSRGMALRTAFPPLITTLNSLLRALCFCISCRTCAPSRLPP